MEISANEFYRINSKLIECENSEVIKVDGVLVSEMSIETKTLLGSMLNYAVIIKYEFYSKKTEIDGKNAIRMMMSELAVNSEVNNFDRVINATIENEFKEVIEALQLGWWRTAKEKALLISTSVYVSQAFIDRVVNLLDVYITNNY